MKIGLYGINVGGCAHPGVQRGIALAAEEVGFESLWTGEHVVLPDPQAPPSPTPPHVPFLDPAVALAYVAAATKTVKLGTGIIILPQRNPLVLAKELASVDVLSEGRLIFGVGVGYLRTEFEALGVSFQEKGARTDEYLDAILAMWTEDKPSYDGRFVSFSGIDAQPRPVQRPHPPIVIGGQSSGAYRRAVARGNGWYGFALDVEATARGLSGLQQAREDTSRPESLGTLEITITPPPGPIDLDTARRYADLGVDRLTLLLGFGGDALPEAIRRAGDELVGKV